MKHASVTTKAAPPETKNLTPRQLRAAQRRFTLFSFINMVSWQLLTGNIITLYALRLGADDLTVGVLYSLIPLVSCVVSD